MLDLVYQKSLSNHERNDPGEESFAGMGRGKEDSDASSVVVFSAFSLSRPLLLFRFFAQMFSEPGRSDLVKACMA